MDLKKMNFKFIEVPLTPTKNPDSGEYFVSLREPLKELRLCLESEQIYLTRNDLLKMLDLWFQIIYLDRTADSPIEEVFALVGYNPNFIDFNLDVFNQTVKSEIYEMDEDFEKKLFVSRFKKCDKEVEYSLPNLLRVIETGKLFTLLKEITIFVDDLLRYIATAFNENDRQKVFYYMPMDDNWSRKFTIRPIYIEIANCTGYIVYSDIMTKKKSKEIQNCYNTFTGKNNVEGTEAYILYQKYIKSHPNRD